MGSYPRGDGHGLGVEMKQRAGVFLLAMFVGGCSDDGPSSPSTTTPATTTAPAAVVLTVVSGETGQPVAGAEVTVAGRTLTTDGTGRVDAGDVRTGANIDIVAEGFLDRQTLYRGTGETRFVLWPATSSNGLTPEITQRLVYSAFGEDAVLGELPLVRPPLGETIFVFVDPGVPDDVRVARVVDDAVTAVRDATRGSVPIDTTRNEPTTGVTWHVRIDPDAVSSEFIAITRWTLDGNEIVSAELSFRSLPDLVDNGRLLTNVMGNAFGLGDSNSPNDRMFFDWWRRRQNNFSPREGLIMRMMLQRPAGNRWPDNDRSLGVSTLRTRIIRYLRTHAY